MKDLRRAYALSWEQAKNHGGDFQDGLLHYLSKNLGMPILNEVRSGSTDEGIEEMCQGVEPVTDTENADESKTQG